MPASPNDPRTKRRAAAGDDINKTAMAPQPLPGMPQDQKAGNSMNYPMIDVEGQMGQKMCHSQPSEAALKVTSAMSSRIVNLLKNVRHS